jgi:hypothetical protein
MAKLDFSDLIPQETGGGEGAKSSNLSFDDLIPDSTTNAIQATSPGFGIAPEVLEGERIATERMAQRAAPLQGRPANIPLPPTGRPAYTLPTQDMPPVQPMSGAGESYREPFQDRLIAPDAFSVDQSLRVEEARPTPDMMDMYRRRFGPNITESQVMEMRRGAAREDIQPRTLGRALEGVGGAESPYFTLTGQESAEETTRRREAAQSLVPDILAETAQRKKVLEDKIAALETEKAQTGGNAIINKAIKTLRTQLGAIETDVKDAEQKAAAIERGPAVTQTQLGAAVQGAPQAVAEQGSNLVSAVQRIALSPIRAMEVIEGVPQDKSLVYRALREDDEARRQAVLGQFNSDVALAEDLGQQVVRGIGSTAGFALTGGALRAGLGLGMTSATAVGGALSQAEEGWKAAERRAMQDPAYGEEWRKWASFALYGGLGATEAVPIGFFFDRLNRASGGGLTRWAGMTLATMGEEGLQEGANKLGENIIAMGLLGDPNVQLTKGVADAMIVGALSGGAFAGTVGGANMALTAGRGPVERQLPPLPLDMQQQAGGAMAPVQAPFTAAVSAPGPASPTAPVEAQGVSPSPTPPAATPQEALAAAPAQAPEQPALQTLNQELANRFPPTQAEVQVLLGAGFAPTDIGDMSPQERLAEIRAAKAEGVQPVELTPQQMVELGFTPAPQAPTPAPVAPTATMGEIAPPLTAGVRVPEAAATPAAPPAIEEAKAPAPKKEGPLKPSLTLPQFIASMGGIKDTDGELKARNLDRMMTGRYGPLVRPNGLSVEDALRAAIDAGYYTVPEREGAAGYQAPAEMIDQFYNDLGAKRRDLEDQRLEAEGAFDKRARVFTAENRRQIEDAVDRAARDFGIRDPEAERMAADYVEEGTFEDPLVALEQATMHLGAQMPEAREVYENQMPPEAFDEIQQGPAPQAGAGAREEGQRAERPAEEERPQEPRGEAPEVRGAGEVTGGSARSLFDEEALSKAEKQNSKSREILIDMPIDDFLALAEKAKGVTQKAAEIRKMLDAGKKLSSIPYLNIDQEGKDARVTGHEGRHRAMVAKEMGYTTIPVVLISRDIRWGEQNNPKSFDYIKQWPGLLRAEKGAADPKFSIPFPVSRATYEAGAEGKPQAVIPGAEQISKAEEAQRGAEKALKPKAPQKDTEGLALFNDSAKQGDLLDMTPKAEKAQEEVPEKVIKEENKGINQLNRIFTEHFQSGGSFKSITEARKMAEQTGITDPKIIEEALELALVRTARGIVKQGGTTEAIYDKMVDLYGRQPKLGTRTSTSVMNQAYSTPMPLAYAASRLAGIGDKVTVYEPTAGNGALLIEADPKFTFANELNRVRRDNLKKQGFEMVNGENAMDIDLDRDISVIIANPPFGVTKDAEGKAITFDMGFIQPGYKTNEIDHAISLKALQGMEQDGRAVLIIGSVNPQAKDRSDAYNGKAKREFFKVLYDNYNVTNHFTVDGKLYDRQGASWPVDVIVIEGVGKSAMPLPAVQPPRILTSWDQVKGELVNERTGPVSEPLAETAKRPQPEGAGVREEQPVGDVVPSRGADVQPTVEPERGVSEPSDQGQRGVELPAEPTVDEERDERGQPERFDLAPAAERRRVEKVETETEKQVSYQPLSTSGINLGTLVPVNMRTSTQDALAKLADQRGSIDGYVANRLGYKPEELGKYFSAEQIDAIGLAINNLERGAGFIIGDQTGIGKGRVNAAIIRYALKTKRIPVFVTEKPNLYGDMYRDLTDTGIQSLLGRDPAIVMTNSGESIPLNDEGTKILKSPGSAAQNKRLDDFAKTGKIGANDVVFTTYSQMQTVKGKETERQRFLRAIAPNAILILDESHNAGGQGGATSEEGGMNRAQFVRDLVNEAQGVFYSSATYAKRPDVMDLYSKTDMALAVDSLEQLAEAIQKGGIPMQQVVASQLAESGQYIRRERSFAGVTYDTPLVPVDRDTYNGFSSALASIQRFSTIVKAATKEISKEVKEEAAMVSDGGSTGGAGAESTNFTAVMHNLINQMLLSMKSNIAADMAIDTLKAGEKPVITVANTMESFLKEFQDETGIQIGDTVNMDFGDLLKRYLEKTRTITIRRPFQSGPADKKYLTDKELGPAGVAAYKRTRDLIDSLDFSKLPISPIDALKAKLQKAGYKVGEITGRNLTLDYTKGKTPILSSRGAAETSIKGRRQTIADFNSGATDAVILNQAGATGLSLHASEKVKDKRKRHMIIAQAEGNIDTHMQMLGRVHRTGQVVVPRYSQIIADIPAEKRPAAVLAKKMASLSANTTGARKGALAAEDVPDFLNKYGDRVAAVFLRDNPEIAERLDVGIPDDKKSEDIIRKVTGRIPLLNLKEQEEMYETLETGYKDLLAQLEAQGVNTLEAQTLDLDAKLVDQRVMKEGTGDSPFTAPVVYGLYNVKRLGKPMDMRTAINEVAKANGMKADELPKEDASALKVLEKAFEQSHRNVMREARQEFDPYMRGFLDEIEKEDTREKEQRRLFDVADRWESIAGLMTPGKRVRVVGENGESYLGVVVKVGRGGKSKNPLALSTWRATIAIPSPSPLLTVPFSQISPNVMSEDMVSVFPAGWAEGAENVADVFNQFASSDIREPRVIITGNILAGFDMTQGRGTIVNFTTNEGDIRQGIMLSGSVKTLDDAGAMSRQKLTSPSQVIEALQMAPGEMLTSRDKNVVLKMKHGRTVVLVPKAKDKGGKYYLDKKLIDMVGDFYSAGRSNMNVSFYNRELPNVVQRLMDLGAIFDGAETDVKPSFGLPENVVRKGERELTDIRNEVMAIAARVVGEFGQVSVVDRIDNKISEQAIRESGYTGPMESMPAFRGLAIGPSRDSVARLLVAVMDNPMPNATAYHEADHVLAMTGAFTKQEERIRQLGVPRIKRDLLAMGVPQAALDQMSDLEVLATGFEVYGAMRDINAPDAMPLPTMLTRLYRKVGRFIESVRNMLAGRGYRTVEDLYEQAYLGRIAERAQQQIDRSGYGETAPAQTGLPSFGQNTQQYIQQMNATYGQQRAAPAGQQATASFVAPQYTRMGEVRRVLQDEFIALKQAQEAIEAARGLPLPEGMNAYMAAMLFPGRHTERLEDFRTQTVEPLIEAMKKEGLTADEVGLYLLARHARERNALMAQRDPKRFGADGGSGLTNDAADAILTDFANSGKDAALRRIASMADKIVEADRDLRLASGLISQQTYDDMTTKFNHYVPLRGFSEMDEGDAAAPRVGRGLSVSKREFQSATGRTSISDNPLYNVILQAEEGIVRAEKNRAAKALLRLAQNNPNPDLWEVNKSKMKRVLGANGLVYSVPDTDTKFGDNVVIAKVGGVPHYILLNSVPLAQAYTRLGAQVLGPVMQQFGKVGRFFSQLQTSRNPEFFLPNVVRDVQEALWTALAEDKKLGARFVKNFLPSLNMAIRIAMGKATPQQLQIYDEWRLSGGKIGYNAFRDITEIAAEIDRIVGTADPLTWKNLPTKTKDAMLAPFRRLFAALDALSQPLENATRMAMFTAARESGYTPSKAANLARESTVNFTRRGAWGPKINALYMFYNASVQGTAKMVELVAKNKAARAAYASLIPLGFFMTLMNLAVSDDDAEEKWKKNYTNIPDYERQGFIIVKTGKGQNDYVKIPLAFGLKIPYYLGEQMAMVLTGQTKPLTASGNVLMNTVDAFNPLGKGSLLNLVAPSLLDPVVDLFTNKNVFGRPIVPEKRDYNEGVPQSSQSFRTTSPVAVSAAQMINEATGGNKYKPGMLDLYPGWIEYAAGWVTGGLGRFTGSVYEWAKNSYEGVPTPIEKIPLARRFSGPERTGPGESFRYYETRKDFEEKANELRKAAAGLKKNPSDQDARKMVRELGKELGGSINARGTIDWQEASPISVINKTDKMLSEYRKQLDSIKKNETLTPVARDTKTRQVEGQIERVQKIAQARLARFTDKERKPGFAPLRGLID